jgi:hypothetical protein
MLKMNGKPALGLPSHVHDGPLSSDHNQTTATQPLRHLNGPWHDIRRRVANGSTAASDYPRNPSSASPTTMAKAGRTLASPLIRATWAVSSMSRIGGVWWIPRRLRTFHDGVQHEQLIQAGPKTNYVEVPARRFMWQSRTASGRPCPDV